MHLSSVKLYFLVHTWGSPDRAPTPSFTPTNNSLAFRHSNWYHTRMKTPFLHLFTATKPLGKSIYSPPTLLLPLPPVALWGSLTGLSCPSHIYPSHIYPLQSRSRYGKAITF